MLLLICVSGGTLEQVGGQVSQINVEVLGFDEFLQRL